MFTLNILNLSFVLVWAANDIRHRENAGTKYAGVYVRSSHNVFFFCINLFLHMVHYVMCILYICNK